ncbi:hypothetical protein QYM36_017700 [Artemia franciscana]|uniref:Uncharacterized protein n=1 Tax=Artemia franciscana TaxID=6661 RepID=A0AA88L1A7_ARTSF|nr:hypothetical protein QYM36_017700 [Artemia franciscana]
MMVEELIDANLETLISDDVEASWLTLKNTLLESQTHQHNMEKETKNSTFPHPKNQETMQQKGKTLGEVHKTKNDNSIQEVQNCQEPPQKRNAETRCKLLRTSGQKCQRNP